MLEKNLGMQLVDARKNTNVQNKTVHVQDHYAIKYIYGKIVDSEIKHIRFIVFNFRSNSIILLNNSVKSIRHNISNMVDFPL